jgi:hypothetical protein
MQPDSPASHENMLNHWASSLLEELLIRGALQIPANGMHAAPVEVSLQFKLLADSSASHIAVQLLRENAVPAVLAIELAPRAKL